jgi:mitochondrial fission protein ELM1
MGRLPNAIKGASLTGLTPESSDSLIEPWPNIIIAAGRRSAPVARMIKRCCGAFLVQIMHPGNAGVDEIDLIVSPRHDRLAPAANIFEIIGAAHRVTPTRLATDYKVWHSRFANLPRPFIAVIVGGSTRRRKFTEAMGTELGLMCNAMANTSGGSLLVTTSRRTEKGQIEALLKTLTVPRIIHTWDNKDENPYFGYLAVADALVVTGDSVSMCSEACATKNPVYIFAPPMLITAKHARLHEELYARGYARPLDGSHSAWKHPHLDQAADIAGEIHRRLAQSRVLPI